MSYSYTTEVLSSLLAYLRQQQSNDDGVATRKAIQSAVSLLEVGAPQLAASPADAAYLRCVLERRWIDQKIILDDRAEKEKLLWQQIVSVTGEPSSKAIEVDDICDELMSELSLTRRETNHGKRKEAERVEPMTDKRPINGILSSVARGRTRGGQLRKGLKSVKDEVEESEKSTSLDHLQPEMVEAIEALRVSPSEATMVRDDDIAGLKFAKQTITEVLIMPQRFPQLFASPLTRPPRGILLFGPPGTGKTMLGRWIASKVNATFINVSASTLFSKWIGESEKMVNTLFQVADHYQPTVIFIDEIDSILGARSEGDHESTRRLKNEFLAALDGVTSKPESRILFLGATNLPWQIDAAALRRFPKKLYTPLPGMEARRYLITRLLQLHHSSMVSTGGLPSSVDDGAIDRLSSSTEGYSGSDIKQLMCAAAMIPIRETLSKLASSTEGDADPPALSPRPLVEADLEDALTHSHASEARLEEYVQWNDKFGSWPTQVVMHDE